MKCVKKPGNEKCQLCALLNIDCVPHISRQGYCSDLYRKWSGLNDVDNGAGHQIRHCFLTAAGSCPIPEASDSLKGDLKSSSKPVPSEFTSGSLKDDCSMSLHFSKLSNKCQKFSYSNNDGANRVGHRVWPWQLLVHLQFLKFLLPGEVIWKSHQNMFVPDLL